MLEVFAGMAVLCATSKAAGLANSIAVDKIRKRSARSSFFQLDLLVHQDRVLLEQWMQSPLLIWIHLALVFGTANRAREIRRFPSDPKPLHSNEWPEGLPDLSDDDHAELESPTSCSSMHAFYFCWLPKWESWRPWRIQGTVIFGLHAGSCNSC